MLENKHLEIYKFEGLAYVQKWCLEVSIFADINRFIPNKEGGIWIPGLSPWILSWSILAKVADSWSLIPLQWVILFRKIRAKIGGSPVSHPVTTSCPQSDGSGVHCLNPMGFDIICKALRGVFSLGIAGLKKEQKFPNTGKIQFSNGRMLSDQNGHIFKWHLKTGSKIRLFKSKFYKCFR